MNGDLAGGLGGVLGLDRKAMEAARLARLEKKRTLEAVGGPSSSDDHSPRPRKIVRVADDAPKAAVVGLSGNEKESVRETGSISPPPRSRATLPSMLPSTRTDRSDSTQSKPTYINGVIKKTWCFGFPRKSDIKLEEVLEKHTLKVAVISSFTWDFDMLATKFNDSTQFILVLQARNEREASMFFIASRAAADISQRQRMEDDFAPAPRIRTVYPPMSGNPYACMHSKLMLLFHSSHLRVVIPSANFIPFDWGMTGVMENSVFLIDLPRLPEERHGPDHNDTLTPFSDELMRFLDAMGMYEDAKAGVLKFDFSRTKELRFVHTIGGTTSGDAVEHTGFPGLSTAIRSLQLQTPLPEPLEVDMAISSIGALDNDQLEVMHRALRGLQATAPAAQSRSKQRNPEKSLNNLSAYRILFPSVSTVRNSKGGAENGGTLFLQPKYFERDTFPRQKIHEYISRREGLLSHNKLILARSTSNAFVYMGSHNLSQAAWGRLTYDKAAKAPKLSATNWECGVIVPVRTGRAHSRANKVATEDGGEADISTASEDEETEDEAKDARVKGGKDPKVLPFSVFEDILDVPFEWPPKKYEDGQKPWCAGTA